MPNYEDYLKSIRAFPSQLGYSFSEIKQLEISETYRNASEIIIAGTGGSSFGGRVVTAIFGDEILTPIKLVTGYNLPSYVDEKSLVIVTSYSGNTEEVLSIKENAVSRGAKVFCITSGGKLGREVSLGKIPGYIFDPKLNISGVPRVGIGYIVGSTLGVLSYLNYIDFTKDDLNRLANNLTHYIQSFGHKVNQYLNFLDQKVPIFITSEHLVCGVHIWRNFMNETSKRFGFVQEVPYMNHHFLDGLKFPKSMQKTLVFIFVKSKLFCSQNQKRLDLTKSVIEDAGYQSMTLSFDADNKLHELWQLIFAGCVASYNLAVKHEVNPSTNDMVDYLKSNL